MTDANLMSTPALQKFARADQRRFWMRWLARYFIVLVVAAIGVAASFRTVTPIPAQQVELVESRAVEITARQATLRARLTELRRELDAARAIGEHPDWSLLLAIVEQSRGDRLEIRSIAVQPTNAPKPAPGGATTARTPVNVPVAAGPRPRRYLLRLGGVATDHSALAAFVLRLEGLGVFERVSLVDNRTGQQSPDQPVNASALVSYMIEADLDDSPVAPVKVTGAKGAQP